MNSYVRTDNPAISRKAKVATFQPNSKQLAKANAIMYSIDRVAFSIKRNPSLSFSKEAHNVAWVALRYVFSGRYVNREWYYMTGEAY